MDAKRLCVSFSAIVVLLLLAMTIVSAATSELATVDSLKVNGISELGLETISVTAGDVVPVEIVFTALVDASDVKIDAELQGQKLDFNAKVNVGDVETGKTYRKVFNVQVPYELKDEVSDDLTLNINLENSDYRTELSEVILRVQRPSYNTGIMSIETDNKVQAGQSFPVDVVLKNVGYNKLDDLYVTVKIPALGLEKVSYLGDLVALETDSNSDNYKESDTVRGRVFLTVPYDAASGLYALEVDASNADMAVSKTKQIFVENAVPETVIKSGDSVVIINPTGTLKVYTVISDNANVRVSDNVVVVPAGASKTVGVTSSSAVGNFKVSVLSGSAVVGSVDFENATLTSGNGQAAGVVVLTVILGVIFVVLLIVLIVLLTKKPDREDELGESYY